MTMTLDDLYTSPDHYLHSYDGDTAVFVPMNRESYHRSIFLDARISTAKAGSMRVPADMLAHSIPQAAPTCWIFHIAHCGSTLLARALDEPSLNLVLREPLALRQVALSPDDSQLAVITAMLAKRYRIDMPTIVKANVPVNFLLPEIVAKNPTASTIFVHYALRDYVLAILRNDKHRDWLRNITAQLGPRLMGVVSVSDAERAAALWAAQMRAFAAAIARLPNARSLDAETFFADPCSTLKAATSHFEVPMPDSVIEARVGSALFSTYSKNPSVTFDNKARVARRLLIEAALAEELAEAQRWIDRPSNDLCAAMTTIAAVKLGG
jgi:hypothetical protein